MEVLVLNTNFEAIGVLDIGDVDIFDSLIWTERYFKCGDFEIYSSVNVNLLTLLQEDYYLWMKGSDKVMIIEGRMIDTDTELGNRFIVTGRSLETVLDRRIIWGQTILSGNLQEGIQQLLNENVINPTIVERKISNFIFESSTDPLITALTIEAQFNGDNLYDSIQMLCEANNIGFKVMLTDDNKFKFKLYSGTDRSYNQLVLPYVIFSPKFENIINSNYFESKKSLKTVALVAGEGAGIERRTTTAGDTVGSGLLRRELFTEAKDISSSIDGGTLSEQQYLAQLEQKGIESLANNVAVKSFEGKVETSKLYTYGENFFMGDIIQITNEYGMEGKARVIELVRSQSLDSIEVYPTFITVE